LFRKVALLGVGLLGGSLGLALRQRRLAGCVQGFVRREASVAECLAAGAVDTASTDLASVVQDADLLVFCTPLGQMAALAAEATPFTTPGALVTDVGSVKANVVAELEPRFRAAGAHFIGSHPMAGSEKTGVGAARAELFRGAVCVVTPTPASDAGCTARIEELWRGLEARVLRLSPETHDALVAHSSHLPQALATTLASLVLDPTAPPEQAQLCAGGFRDGTRIASGSPEMWRDIFVANRVEVARALEEFGTRLDDLRRAIVSGDPAAIAPFLTTARQRREAWLKPAGTDPSE
jgi:prephenate dehydrogenase